MRKSWSKEKRKMVISLIKDGKTYSYISKQENIAKSTIHEWIKKEAKDYLSTHKSREEWVKKLQAIGSRAQRQKRLYRLENINNQVNREVNSINLLAQEEKIWISLLYWAEGGKSPGVLQFVNTDPEMMKLFLLLLRKNYTIDESKLRLRLHLHDYHIEAKIKEYWSTLLNIPLSNFHKTYFKTRSKEKVFRRNKYGICTLKYNNVSLKETIVQYAYSFSRKILTVPVA